MLHALQHIVLFTCKQGRCRPSRISDRWREGVSEGESDEVERAPSGSECIYYTLIDCSCFSVSMIKTKKIY